MNPVKDENEADRCNNHPSIAPFCKKVVARQFQIPPEYISKFIEQYNNGCVEDFKIEMKTKTYQPCDNNYEKCGEPFNIDEPKLHNGFVTIIEKPIYQQIIDTVGGEEAFCKLAGIKKEPISYTLYNEEEVRIMCLESFKQGITFSHKSFSDTTYYRFKTWFEQNKKK